MGIWQKIKQSFVGFMQGRYGADQLSLTLVYGGLALYILDMFLGSGFLSLIGLGLYIWSAFRIFSRNTEKRRAENMRFQAFYTPKLTKLRQAKNRYKNRKQYKYFKCPQCHAWLRLPHGAGEVSVTCGKCKNKFLYKA